MQRLMELGALCTTTSIIKHSTYRFPIWIFLISLLTDGSTKIRNGRLKNEEKRSHSSDDQYEQQQMSVFKYLHIYDDHNG